MRNDSSGRLDKVREGFPAYMDMVRVEITRTSDSLVLVMEMAAPVPEQPPLEGLQIAAQCGDASCTSPSAVVEPVVELKWIWSIDTDRSTCATGFPWAPGTQYPYETFIGCSEIMVEVVWDGTAFAGLLIDRRPILTGGEVIVTPIRFTISGATVQLTVDLTTIELPDRFGWWASTLGWPQPQGTATPEEAWFTSIDHVPDQGETLFP